jgi:hypothetical protein
VPDFVRAAGLVLTEHEFSVPLDHDRPDRERITVFAREVADPDGLDRPFLVFLQGGPGSEAPRPARHPDAPAWLGRALREFRGLMLDQRGAGRSTPIGRLAGRTPGEQAEYLAHFRADAIVRDAEPDGCSTRWSAQRLLPPAYEDPELFTGEHVYPWMFEDYAALVPLRQAAELLAEREWPRLYDPEQLRRNAVPAAAAVYAGDMYVERAFSEETAAQIRGLRAWVTSEYEHDGLRADGERILGRLIDLARGRA